MPTSNTHSMAATIIPSQAAPSLVRMPAIKMVEITSVNKHRRRTPDYVRANPLIEFVNLTDSRGPDRRRSGPHPKRISSCYIKALR